MKIFDYTDDGINYKDTVYGTVTYGCRDGLIILLDNGDMAFAGFSHLDNGTRVLCTLFRKVKGKRYAYVGIDPVIKEEVLA